MTSEPECVFIVIRSKDDDGKLVVNLKKQNKNIKGLFCLTTHECTSLPWMCVKPESREEEKQSEPKSKSEM